MSLDEPDRQALDSIEGGLAGSDPALAAMLNIFSRLAAGEGMPALEKIRARRQPRRGMALTHAGRVYPRLGLQQAVFLLWAVISAALLAVALILNASGHAADTRPTGTAPPSPPPPSIEAGMFFQPSMA